MKNKIGMLHTSGTFTFVRLPMTECMIYKTPFVIYTAVADIQLLLSVEYTVSLLPDIKEFAHASKTCITVSYLGFIQFD